MAKTGNNAFSAIGKIFTYVGLFFGVVAFGFALFFGISLLTGSCVNYDEEVKNEHGHGNSTTKVICGKKSDAEKIDATIDSNSKTVGWYIIAGGAGVLFLTWLNWWAAQHWEWYATWLGFSDTVNAMRPRRRY